MRATSHRIALGLGLAALALASCSGEKRSEKVASAPVGPAPAVTPVAPLPTAAEAPPVPTLAPETTAAIDTAVAGAKAFNAKALTDLAAIEKSEKRVRDQAARALDAARRGDTAKVTAARADAEAAHRTLADNLSSFRTAAAAQQATVAAALALCAPPAPAPGATASPTVPPPPPVTTPTPGAPATTPAPLATYEGCTGLVVEQTLLAQNIDAVSARYQAAEASYRQDRPKLEEAAATVALGKLAPL